MEHAYVQLMQTLTAHAAWLLAFVFLAAFLESLAVIGTFVPGSTAMFVAGALVGTGAVNLGWLFAFAIAGAVAGDGISYWIGRRYRERLGQIWPFSTHPGILTAAQQYFVKHGARSVIFARFIAPLRALVPVVAGMVGMSPLRFLGMNVLSALIWAPAHIVPGVVFGASLELAGAVSLRLVVLIGMVVAAGWVLFQITRTVLLHARAWTDASRRSMLAWVAHHPGRAANRLRRLLDPAQPVLGLIVAITALVPLCAGIFSYVLTNVLHGDPLVQVDVSVYQFLRSMHTSWADDVLARVTTLGSPPTLIALVLAVGVWLMLERRWRTITYWAIAALISQLVIVIIRVLIHHEPPGHANADAWLFPSDRIAALVTVYGFTMFLLVRRVGMLQSIAVATVGNAIVVAVAFAGLYFGRYLFSDAIGGAAFASIWVALLALTAMWRYPDAPPTRPYVPLVMLTVLCVAAGLQPATRPEARGVSEPRAPTPITRIEWTDNYWRTLPCYRMDMHGSRREAMTLQWAGSAAQLASGLRAAGWQDGTPVSVHSVLSLVAPGTQALALPVLPKLNNGVPSTLNFARTRGDGEQRDVLRFWPTSYTLQRANGAPTPIWLGSLVHERLRRPTWPINVLMPYADPAADIGIAPGGQPAGWRTLAMPGSLDCEGKPVTLIVSDAP